MKKITQKKHQNKEKHSKKKKKKQQNYFSRVMYHGSLKVHQKQGVHICMT